MSGNIVSASCTVSHDGRQNWGSSCSQPRPKRQLHESDAAEAARVTEVVQHAALSRPEIRWTLITDGREQLQTSGSGDIRDVMLTLYGPEVVRDLLPVNDQDGTG